MLKVTYEDEAQLEDAKNKLADFSFRKMKNGRVFVDFKKMKSKRGLKKK